MALVLVPVVEESDSKMEKTLAVPDVVRISLHEAEKVVENGLSELEARRRVCRPVAGRIARKLCAAGNGGDSSDY